MTNTEILAAFAANLKYEQIPTEVVRRTEDLFLDWFGAALAGRGARPVESIQKLALDFGPQSGPCEILISRRTTSPLFAAMVNAAASHFAEQDDLHNSSVLHPATVVFPAAWAAAQALGRSGKEFIAASVAGYEVGIRVGEFLGRSHYKIFHTTGTVGTLAAAAAVGNLLRLDEVQMLHAFGSAGTQAAGLWEFLRDAADSKQLHTAKAAANGLLAAYLAADGFTGAEDILEGVKGMGAGMSAQTDPQKLVDRLSERWALVETSFKFHASCRHTHPAADALLHVLRREKLSPGDIETVVTHVHQAAIDVLGPVTDPKTIHQAKFSMGTVLALAAEYGHAGVREFDAHYKENRIAQFRDKVSMVLDPEVDTAYPARWIGKITVQTKDGQTFTGRIDDPKGDPGNTLTRAELEHKTTTLGLYGNAAAEEEIQHAIASVWSLADCPVVPRLLPEVSLESQHG
ncbi:MmgE/PrpD family protein [Paraburkholderia hospita]|jgi:2-methylcitrate dehydratase PrpD|uniref:MmgE/PrpD family protein n=1 Tax=Paraburkholderia hospita TaxID=169430 RepID=A0AAN1JID0_9BURK|nr:MmgE/PrpD family protein [Paraburkholderia hospita]AUT74556.1 MmgE/PrpD family protein [Paraburkholderia hospita]EIN01602.1 MmgE/PrpD family protein 3 [Paraburkholderia hospita]OUL75132.1 2-methylcitrate dehydratase [Paraburkholderia hospita]OUL79821.1 2-methylcitrate dehydratase [Paraburkholderia hospita]SEI26136.1 2-methylcitrate dehydratase PrpD [Paraburkholderia hospita]